MDGVWKAFDFADAMCLGEERLFSTLREVAEVSSRGESIMDR